MNSPYFMNIYFKDHSWTWLFKWYAMLYSYFILCFVYINRNMYVVRRLLFVHRKRGLIALIIKIRASRIRVTFISIFWLCKLDRITNIFCSLYSDIYTKKNIYINDACTLDVSGMCSCRAHKSANIYQIKCMYVCVPHLIENRKWNFFGKHHSSVRVCIARHRMG